MTIYTGTYGAMVATKAGRESLARQLHELADRLDWSTEIESAGLDPREISVTMSRGVFAVTVHLTGGSKVGAFLGHWHTKYPAGMRWPPQSPADNPPTAEYPDGFAGASCTHHRAHHKATTCTEEWRPFLRQLQAGMEDCNTRLAAA